MISINLFGREGRPLSTLLLAGVAAGAIAMPQQAYAQGADAEADVEAVPTAGPTEVPAPEAAPIYDEIIVTANRREERQQDVPIAITALSPQRLEQQGINEEQDLQASVPSLVVGPNGQGSRDSQSFTIRGQGATFQASPGVVVYVNEVPLPAAVTLSQQGGPGNFVDLESLQVLSGPQGTLFGRNTTGGAVLLTPAKPKDEFGGWIKAETGNYDRAYVEGALNVPVVEDKLLVRAVGAYHSRRGFTRDVVWDKYRDNENWYSGRLGITFRPNEHIENYTMAYFAHSENNGAGLVNRGFNIEALDNAGVCTIGVDCDIYEQVTEDAKDLGNRKTAFSTDVFQETKTFGITNTTDFELDDNLTLRNIFSFQKLKIGYRYDGDASILQQHDVDPGRLPEPGEVILPVINMPVVYNNETGDTELPRDDLKQFTEELQLQGTSFDDALEWTVGGFYYNQRPDGPQGSRAITYCPATFTGNCEASYNRYSTSTESKALYAQGTLDLGLVSTALENVRLTGGYRYTWDRIKGSAVQYQRSTTDPTEAVCGSTGDVVDFDTAADDCGFGAELKTKAPSWLIGLDYKITPDIMLFGKVSRGYKAGGFNQYAVRTTTQTFEPETVTSYEIGVKSDFRIAEMPVRLNVTAYTLDYKGIQRAAGDFNLDTGQGGAQTRNADAEISGIELDGYIRPLPGLEIGGNFSYTDGEYTKYEYETDTGGIGCDGFVPAGGTVDVSCLDLQYVAKYIWSAHLSYEHELANNLGTLAFFTNYSRTSRQFTEAINIPSVQPGAYLEPFGLLSASLDWRGVGGSGFDIGIFGTNLTDETYRISNSDVFQQGGLLYQATLYGEPRMYGLRATFRFGGERR